MESSAGLKFCLRCELTPSDEWRLQFFGWECICLGYHGRILTNHRKMGPEDIAIGPVADVHSFESSTPVYGPSWPGIALGFSWCGAMAVYVCSTLQLDVRQDEWP